MMIDGKKTLVHGELTKESFDDFVKRMHHDVRGKGVDSHATCDATFVVQRKRLICGIDKDYTDNTCLVIDDSVVYNFDEFIESFDNDELDEFIEEGAPFYLDDGLYICSSDKELFDWVEDNYGCEWSATHTGYDHCWEYVNHHMTRDAAETFIKRKRHDYGEMRVFVDSAYWSWEFKAIMDAILDGKIAFNA